VNVNYHPTLSCGRESYKLPAGWADGGVRALRDHLIVYRFAIVNIVGFALFGMAAAQGWLSRMVDADSTGLVYVIFGVFLVGLGSCAYKLYRTSVELINIKSTGTLRSDRARRYTEGRPEMMAEALKAELFSRIISIRQYASALVVLGLIGTVTGFIIALSGVTAEEAGDLAAVQPMIAQLISGMSIALYTTLEGAILGLWLTVNHRILSTGTSSLYSEILALHGRV